MAHLGDAMDVPTQGLTAMGINILERDDDEVKGCNKMIGEEKLLPQLTIHIVDKMPTITILQKLANGERFQN